MRILYVIPARGGSKGIPGKNIKPLAGKPLILYTLEVARSLAADEDICVSTDDKDIIALLEQTRLNIPFTRPAHLATDDSSMQDVLLHALSYYKSIGKEYDLLVLLQPTSPFRKVEDVRNCINCWNPELDMVVSVKITNANPYYTLFEENERGELVKCKEGEYTRRQDCPDVYEYNGAVYVINTSSLKRDSLSTFKHKIKYVMDDLSSIDIDTPIQWDFAEYLLQHKKVNV